jgi:predicted amidohydrolase
MPEYAAVEAAMIGAPDGDPDPLIWAQRAAAAHGDWVAICSAASQEFGLFVLAGSGPVKVGDSFVNRAVFCAPDGSTAFQDKMIPTPNERNSMGMVGGAGLKLFDTPLGKIGVTICYDVEFPMFARALCAAGAEVILAPACTDTQAGQDRIQIAARARALENQCLVVHAPMKGAVEGCDLVSDNIGRAGMYGPPDWQQPEGGIHALAHPDSDRWVRRAIDLEPILGSRTAGDVEIFSDWPSMGIPDLDVKIVTLGK